MPKLLESYGKIPRGGFTLESTKTKAPPISSDPICREQHNNKTGPKEFTLTSWSMIKRRESDVAFDVASPFSSRLPVILFKKLLLLSSLKKPTFKLGSSSESEGYKIHS